MDFQPDIWLSELRDVLRTGVVPATGQMRNRIQLETAALAAREITRLRVSGRNETLRVIQLNTGVAVSTEHWNNLLDVFTKKIEQLAKYSSRTPFPKPILELSPDQQSKIVTAYFDNFVELSTRWGSVPSRESLHKMPSLYMTADQFDDLLGVEGLSKADIRHFAISCPKDTAKAVHKALTAIDDLLALDADLTWTQARRFAIHNSKDPQTAARKALASTDDLLALDAGLTRGQARHFAISYPKDPLAAAQKALGATDDLLALDAGLTRAQARYFAISNPKDPLAAAQNALAATDELLALDIGLTRCEARHFAIRYSKNSLAAAHKALEATDDLLALGAGLTRTEARRFAIGNPKDPLAAAQKALTAAEALRTINPELTKAQAMYFASHNPHAAEKNASANPPAIDEATPKLRTNRLSGPSLDF